jgi:non-haem Fe2+, alpha-ketoglutarate-dependent halogenase
MDNCRGLTDAEIESFRENGFVGPFDLYPADLAPTLWDQAKIEMVLSENKPHTSTVINYDRHLDCDTLSEHIARPEIVNKVRGLIGADILCWKTNIFKKEPGEIRTGWHQVEAFAISDASATKSSPSLSYTEPGRWVSHEVSVWTAFSPAKRENGCLTFIPGSHKRLHYDEFKPLIRDTDKADNDFFGYDYGDSRIDPAWDPDQQDHVAMEMEAGQFVIFVEKCVHGSLVNTSNVSRVGFASRYIPPSVKVYENLDTLTEFGDTISLDYHGCVLVSGTDTYGYNRIHERNLNGFEFKKVGV